MGSYIILIGNYGSGKTEIALNLAVNSASAGKKTKVVDLDKVNDYFRMSDRVALLEGKKIDVVSPTYAGRGVTPVNMSAAVASAFVGNWDLVVFDVGGDAAGAMSLGRYHQDFAALPEGSLEVYDIVNVFRPMSESPERVLKLREEMEGFARLPVTGFVNNANLLTLASADDLRRGYDVLRETSDLAGLPVRFTTARPEFLAEFLADGRDMRYVGTPLALKTYIHRSWEAYTREGF
ncbi:MAG: hypothetical protein VB058_03195 [Oscillospiraceae bacterium]|nr:hypothetical protein [Oscillospiraceae bacterium]